MLNGNHWVIWTAAVGWWVFLILLCSSTNPQPVVELPRGPVELERDRVVPYDNPANLQQQPLLASFGGYPCAGRDCDRHAAGYRWAIEHGVTNPDNCDGISAAFIEGCRVFAHSASETMSDGSS